mmetsp:Transcript_53563/g.138474  ORF Transcript_53563/g.138474 Transcript_53563/m.138474 type:complete len:221 (+) Transcript_53563:157-819(+)
MAHAVAIHMIHWIQHRAVWMPAALSWTSRIARLHASIRTARTTIIRTLIIRTPRIHTRRISTIRTPRTRTRRISTTQRQLRHRSAKTDGQRSPALLIFQRRLGERISQTSMEERYLLVHSPSIPPHGGCYTTQSSRSTQFHCHRHLANALRPTASSTATERTMRTRHLPSGSGIRRHMAPSRMARGSKLCTSRTPLVMSTTELGTCMPKARVYGTTSGNH